ncbi:MAG: response regulator [Rhodocyclaceae bacterium]|nr:response regulator [Rhodocyclaceae bacterium]MBX3667884.1 response regulator [Rhodocyclaceae bacterium]
MNSSLILCVDDDPANLALMRACLQESYPLVFARSGADALRAVVKHRPALVLLDVQLPDFDGLAVARRIKADPLTDHIPIIFVSNLSAEYDEQAGFDAGAVDYVSKPVSPALLRARVRTHLSLVHVTALQASQRAAIAMLGEAGHYNDNDTGVHIWRMAAYARILAEAVGWHAEQAEMLNLAAPMHDTGKIGIPHAILKKPGKLDAEEWTVMRTHSRIGHDILRKSDAPLFRLAAEIALNHHEKWDGSGYPNGIAGANIPQSARIVAVADVFDALSMKRPYKDAWPLQRVMTTLHESAGTHLDAELVQAFDRHLPEILAAKAHWDGREASVAACA